jgi:hypothetical protein
MGGALRAVVGHHFGHRHFGNPLSMVLLYHTLPEKARVFVTKVLKKC